MVNSKSPVSKSTVLIFLFATVFANAAGNVCLSHGMKSLGADSPMNITTLLRALDHSSILWGIGLLLLFFGGFLLLLSWADLSFVLPLLSVSYVVNVILARIILGEDVPITRWIGVLLICAGAYYISTTMESGHETSDPRRPADTP